MGFDADVLQSLEVPGLDNRAQLRRVLYGLEEASDQTLETLDRLARTGTDHTGVAAHYALIQDLVPLLAQIKHPTFREEQEWRLVLIPEMLDDLGVRVRPSDIGISLYVPLPSLPGAIKEIVIGPGEYAPTRKQGVEELVRVSPPTFDDISISFSEAPLRV